MKVYDSDDQVHDLNCCMHNDTAGKPIRKYYFFDPRSTREMYGKALDKVSHMDVNKFERMRSDKRD